MTKSIKSLLLHLAMVCLASAAMAAQAQSQSKNFLWEVKSKTNTVYLYGTIHVGKKSFYPLPEAVETAFKKSARLVVEADIGNQDSMAAALPLIMYLPPDSLDTRIPKAALNRLKVQLARYEIPYESVQQFKPFMVGGMLVAAEFARLGYDPRYGVDKHLLEQAALTGKTVLELESVEQQMKLLGSLSDLEQEAFLVHAIVALEDGTTVKEVVGMIEALRAGDATLLEEVAKQASEGMPKGLEEKILYGRNPAMLAKIEGFLAGKQIHFVAVGAMHMIGKRGLVEMLKAKGYEVRQL